jgi:cell division protein FtsW (lipid II flippase)
MSSITPVRPSAVGEWTLFAWMRLPQLVARQLGISWMSAGWIPVAAALALTAIGIAAIDTTQPAYAARQLAYAAVGLVMGGLCVVPPSGRIERWSPWLFGLTLLSLVALIMPGVPESIVRPRNGSRCWIDLGPIDVQPAEFAKLAWIMATAWWLRRAADVQTVAGLALPFAITAVPVVMILAQPDLGTALLFFPTLLAMLLAQGARKAHIALVVAIAAVLGPASYPVLKPHQRARIDALIAQVQGSDRYVRSIGFQGDRAVTLIASGGVLGHGKSQASALVRHNALPEEHNDMIFAVAACRWGLAGGIAIVALQGIYALGALWIAAVTRSRYGRLAATGIGIMCAWQATVNLGMTVGLLPITGLTLPFVSAGGSSMVAAWMATGILFGIAARQSREVTSGMGATGGSLVSGGPRGSLA